MDKLHSSKEEAEEACKQYLLAVNELQVKLGIREHFVMDGGSSDGMCHYAKYRDDNKKIGWGYVFTDLK